MPDEELKKNEQEEPENETGEEKPGLPLKKYGIYVAIVIVIMAAAYFVTLKVVKPMFAGDSGSVGEKIEEKEEPHKKKAGEKEHKTLSNHGSGDAQFAAGDVHLIEDIIVNPAGTGGRRFLSTSIGFELETAHASELMDEREAVVRDALITILSSQSIPELSDFKQRERLRKLIKLRVEKLLHTEDIAAVYFTEFVLQ